MKFNNTKRVNSDKKYFHIEKLIDIFSEFIQNNLTVKVVDFGCHDGHDIIELAKKFNIKFSGYDISDLAINNGKKKIISANLQNKINLSVLDINNLSNIKNKTYDFCLCKYVLPFIKNKKKFLQEIKRIVIQYCILVVPTRRIDIQEFSKHTLGISITEKELDILLSEVFPDNYEIIETFNLIQREYQIKLIKIKIE